MAEVDRIRAEGDLARAIVAYRFWYPTVSVEGIFNGNRELGAADNQALGIAACGPRHVGFTLNSDTPYGSATLDLTDGPMVIDLPAGPYIGLVDDHHQGWITDMGIPGPDRGSGGSYAILPPGYDGPVPDGHHVASSRTVKALLAVRAMPAGGDVDAALTSLHDIKIHRLGDDRTLDVVEFTDRPIDCTCLRWEDGIDFWRVLHEVVNAEPVVDEYRPMYGLLTALGIGRGQPFAPDDATAALLERAARVGLAQMMTAAFASARADRMAWPDRRWEWVGLVPGDPDFETPDGLDVEARAPWFAPAIVTSPAMFRRQEGGGSLYWLSARDSGGDHLDGGRRYTLTLPLPVPAGLFWSVTVYDAATRSQVQADQDRAALRSLFELRDTPAGDGAVTLHFGPEPPDEDDRARWLQTVPGRGWFAYIRIYGPQAAAFDGSWRPGDFTAA